MMFAFSRQSIVWMLLFAVPIGGVIGCKSKSDSIPDKKTTKKTTPVVKKQPMGVTLVDADPDQLKAEIAKHKGKVVFVDFWGMW